MDAIIDEVRFDVPSPPRRSSSLHETPCPNGGILGDLPHDDEVSEAPDVPLLSTSDLTSIVRRRPVKDELSEPVQTKRWKSLETVQTNCEEKVIQEASAEDGSSERKQNTATHNSLKNWLVGLFNGNGLRASNTSLRKGVLAGYSDLQVERESIV